MKKLIYIFVLSVIIMACPLLPDDEYRENCNGVNFSFPISISLTPSDSIIHIGDTVSITSDFSAVIWDDRRREQLYFDSIDFLMAGNLFRLDTILNKGDYYDFYNYFDIIVDSIYGFKNSKSAFGFDYLFANNRYSFSFKLVPKHKGIFLFKMLSLFTKYQKKYQRKILLAKNSDCSTDDWKLKFQTNNLNTHRELLKLSYDDYYRTWYYDNWSRFEEIEGGYLFKVE